MAPLIIKVSETWLSHENARYDEILCFNLTQ